MPWQVENPAARVRDAWSVVEWRAVLASAERRVGVSAKQDTHHVRTLHDGVQEGLQGPTVRGKWRAHLGSAAVQTQPRGTSTPRRIVWCRDSHRTRTQHESSSVVDGDTGVGAARHDTTSPVTAQGGGGLGPAVEAPGCLFWAVQVPQAAVAQRSASPEG